MGKEQHVRGMEKYFCRERERVKKFRGQAEEEKQAGLQGQWHLESPANEYLEQVKRRDDTHCAENDEEGLCRLEKWRLGRIQKAFSGLK